MEIKKIIGYLLIIIIACPGCNRQVRIVEEKSTITFEDYFPLKTGRIETFNVSHITKADTLIDDKDSSICKSIFIKGRKIYFFDDGLQTEYSELIGCLSFCNGVFYFDKGDFYYSPITWKDELEEANLDYFEILLPNTIKFDSIYKYKNGEEIRKYKFIGFESIKIKHNVFSDCLKLTVTQDWPTAQYTDTLWFYKGRGVVRWYRGTGRLEEII